MAEAEKLTDCRIGQMLSTVLFSHAPRLYRLFPTMIGLDMWRLGAGNQTMDIFHQLGLSVNAAAARTCVDKIANEYKQEIQQWKHKMTNVSKLITYIV